MSLTCLQITRAAVSFYSSLTLWERVKQANPNTNSLLLNTNTFAPLTAGGIRKLAKEALTNAGIPDTFTTYSIKAASISALTMAGIPPVQIAKFARLSTQTNTLVKHYFRADLASAMGKVIASSPEISTKQAQRAEKDEQKGRKESQNNDEKKVAIVKKQNNMSKRNEKIQAFDDSQTIMPSKIEEPKEDEKEDTEYDKRFIIRTRAQ
ncbi:uncharacterized protein MONOS_14384 [Monocercomonoides exilis]|uniref:uncharacterized protein n=1 Tax=Monocercomonoides exilis TaxID=2049356 RepID=UPI003559B3CD|nr:hypothetical protein MONOS_14384 [Monocercomonoides exilis]|eukprot:MONOS_14384.1-p1 / transcript=MONOS_14384.1 / gene=MONOS_14384 / organism=Monocercomonoides_exilis_PA203 / gene_product=unspecified product / transcript_product=unspecified product / location=Mono_scaffold00993:12471-13466(-) / protein_length=208 / sequence_SO=supercontig / SO=protein_coding / is_pseudo=false